jgi:hypothetical protein
MVHHIRVQSNGSFPNTNATYHWTLFENEWQWMKDHRWQIAETHATFLILLDANKMSLFHLDQVRRWMAEEAAQKVKAEEDTKKVARPSGASLTGGYIRQ